MSMADKAGFLHEAERQMGSCLTAEDMNKALRILTDVLEEYDMTQIAVEDNGHDDLMRIYLATMRIQGRSEKTVRRYEYVIRRLLDETGVRTRQMNVYHIRNWLAKEKDRGISDSTLHGSREVFCSYFNWLQREGLIERNPVANLGTIKVPKKKKTVITRVEMEKLNNSCENVRDRAIIAFLRSTGCRISEMVQLNRNSIDLERMRCKVVGKGNKERFVYPDEVACMLIDSYLKSRTDGEEALFIGLRKDRLTPEGVRQMLKVLAAKAGVENVHPHKFRRTYATNLIRHGMQIQEVASVLGHEKLDTTLAYLVQDDNEIQHSVRRHYA